MELRKAMNTIQNSNTLKIFEHPNPHEIRARIDSPHKGSGFVYVMEVGNYVKIGCTTKPDKRFAQIRQGATGYGGVDVGRFAISASVKDFYGWEARLHCKFHELRKEGTELFSVPFEAAVTALVRDEEKEAISDEFEIVHSSANYARKVKPIYKNGVASQIFTLLIGLTINERYAYTSKSILKYLIEVSESDINDGLSFLRDKKVIKTTDCGENILIEFL